MNNKSNPLSLKKAQEKQLEILELLKELAKRSHRTISMSVIKEIEKNLNSSYKINEIMNYYCHPHLWGGCIQPLETLKEVMGNHIEYSTDPNKGWGNWLSTLRYIQAELVRYSDLINKIQHETSFSGYFCKYYERLMTLYNKEFRTKPTTIYCEGWNHDIITSEADADGYCKWKYCLQSEKVNLKPVERTLGFALSKNIKDFFTTYTFPRISCMVSTNNIENIELTFFGVNYEKPTINCILQSHKDGNYYYKNAEVLLLGIANIDGDDGFSLFYDNKNDTLFLMNTNTFEESNHKKKTRISLGKLLSVFKKIKPSL